MTDPAVWVQKDGAMPDAGPKLAVIIPSFNYERFIGRAIESVLRQDCAECEIIVVDDESTDGSWDVIQSYSLAKCFRVTNGGPAKACLHGLLNTKAPFALFLDSDDEMKPGSLEQILAHLDPGVAKLQFALTPIDSDGETLGPAVPVLTDFRDGVEIKREILKTGSYTSPPTSGNVFRRDIALLLHDVDYDIWVDGVLLFAAPFFGDVVSLSAELGCYRLHGRNQSQLSATPSAERFQKEAERFATRLDHLDRILQGAGVRDALPKSRKTFFYRERQLYGQIADGKRPKLGTILSLQYLLFRQPIPLNNRVGLSAFLWFSLALSRERLGKLLSYRFQVQGRSAMGLIKALI